MLQVQLGAGNYFRAMKPIEGFGIAVRIIGMILLILAALYIASGTVVLIDPKFKPNVSPAWHYFLVGIIGILISLYLLRGAPHIVRFAYPEEDSDPKTD